MKFGDYTLDINEEALFHNGVLVKQLSIIEYKLLNLLASNINTVVKRDVMINKAWGDVIVSGHSVTNFIARLRRYISEDKGIELVTVSKVGYKLISK